jgi:hypothetical protein
MGTFILKAGDFGAGSTVLFGDDLVHLPNPDAPGGVEHLSVRALVEVEPVAADSTDRVNSAVKFGLSGFAALGPIGLAASALALGRAKQVTFMAKLADGRHFVATADARSLADLRALRGGRVAAPAEDVAAPEEVRAIDDMIARYAAKSGLAVRGEAPSPTARTAATRTPDAAPPSGLDLPAGPPRKVFGRRGTGR